MKLTRQHFQLIAETLAEERAWLAKHAENLPNETAAATQTLDNLVNSFADQLAKTNGSFNRERFGAVATGERAR